MGAISTCSANRSPPHRAKNDEGLAAVDGGAEARALRRRVRSLLSQSYPVDRPAAADPSDPAFWRDLFEERAVPPGPSNVNFAGYQCNIHMADGIYTGGLAAAGSFIGANNADSPLILGNSSDPTAVVIHTTGADCVDVSAGGSISLKHLTIVSTTSGGAGGDGVTASYAGEPFLYDMNFSACSGNQLYAAGGGSVIVMTGYQITGGAQVHAQAAQQGYIEMSSNPARHVAVALVGNPNFSAGFVLAGDGGLHATNNVFTGTATGPRYDAHLNGVIHLTAGRVAALGLILFIVGNELSEPGLRQVLEILAGVLAAAGPLFE
jgi:hypothetical protein